MLAAYTPYDIGQYNPQSTLNNQFFFHCSSASACPPGPVLERKNPPVRLAQMKRESSVSGLVWNLKDSGYSQYRSRILTSGLFWYDILIFCTRNAMSKMPKLEEL